MIEFKDVIQTTIAIAGWSLAAFQYWRNELVKRPLVLVEAKRIDPTSAGVLFTVRNRGPWDVRGRKLDLLAPAHGQFVERDYRMASTPLGRNLALTVRLKAHASGDFPSIAKNLFVEGLSASDASVSVRVEMQESRSTWWRRSMITRVSHHKVKI